MSQRLRLFGTSAIVVMGAIAMFVQHQRQPSQTPGREPSPSVAPASATVSPGKGTSGLTPKENPEDKDPDEQELRSMPEALSWLKQDRHRTVGRFIGPHDEGMTQGEGISYIQHLYALGAQKVRVMADGENAVMLVVFLPDDQRRKELISLSNQLRTRFGFEPQDDAGGAYLMLYWGD